MKACEKKNKPINSKLTNDASTQQGKSIQYHLDSIWTLAIMPRCKFMQLKPY